MKKKEMRGLFRLDTWVAPEAKVERIAGLQGPEGSPASPGCVMEEFLFLSLLRSQCPESGERR